MKDKIEHIYRFSRQMTATTNQGVILENTAREAVQMLQVNFCRVLVVQKDGSWQSGAVFPDWIDPGSSSLMKLKAAASIFRQAAQKPRPTVLRRGSAQWVNMEGDILSGGQSICMCLVPIRLDGEVLGMLVIGPGFNKNGPVWFGEDKKLLAQFIAEQAAGAINRATASFHLQENRAETVQALSRAIEIRDDFTGGHCDHMTGLAERIACVMQCSEAEIQTIRWAGKLHDIGKIGVPDAILRRPGPLNEQEWLIIRRHPDIGAEIVMTVSHLQDVAELVRCHHEHFDGGGYPRRLAGEKIPLGARILAVVDAYTAMTDGRCYRPAISHLEAMQELARCAGKDFDPGVVAAFSTLFQ